MSLESPFNLKEDLGKGGFNDIKADVDFKPVDWLSFYFDSIYDPHLDRLETANFDIYLYNKRWYLNFGKRLVVRSSDEITSEVGYIINPKWRVRIYHNLDVRGANFKEQNYSIVRDLHEWEMEINFNETHGEGSEILCIFHLKAFPEIGFDFGNSFNQRKVGSQWSPQDTQAGP